MLVLWISHQKWTVQGLNEVTNQPVIIALVLYAGYLYLTAVVTMMWNIVRIRIVIGIADIFNVNCTVLAYYTPLVFLTIKYAFL